MAGLLLVVGYAVAVPLVVRLPSTPRRRRLGELVALELATAVVAVGWAAQGSPVGVALNVVFLCAFPVLWWRRASSERRVDA